MRGSRAILAPRGSVGAELGRMLALFYTDSEETFLEGRHRQCLEAERLVMDLGTSHSCDWSFGLDVKPRGVL